MATLIEIFQDIDRVDWSKLQHAYGSAADVPAMLRGLVSQDEDVQDESLYQLCSTIWHQGSVYEATPHAVPILLDMLRTPEVPAKAGIAMLLAELADGSASLEGFADEKNPLSQTFRDHLKREGRDFDEELEQGRAYLQATRAAVGLGIEHLYDYLTHEEPAVREAVARAFAHYPHRADELLLLLEHARASETEDYVLDSIERSIKTLQESG